MPTTSEATATNSSATYTSGAGGGPLLLRLLELRGDIVAFLDHAVSSAFDDLADGFVGSRIDDHDLGENLGSLAGLVEPRTVDRHLVPFLQPLIASQRNLDQLAGPLPAGRLDLFDDSFDLRRRAGAAGQLVRVG